MIKTFQSSILAVAMGIGAIVNIPSAMGQGLPDDFGGTDGFEVEIDSGQGGLDWSRYIGGTVGAVTADGDTISRQLAALQLDINLPATDTVKTVISVDFADFENTYTQELRPEVIRNGNLEGLDEERETTVSDSFVDFREAYVQWEPTDFATLTLGRQNLVWGQFEFLSPVGFLLPFRGTNTSPRPGRADFSYAQDAANLALFPTSNSELQLIHVPQMRIDPSVEENLKSYSQNRYCDRLANDEFDCPAGFAFPDAADYDMSALRFTHYGERLTLAVTALDGTLFQFDPVQDATLVASDDGQGYRFDDDNGLFYGDLETVTFEFAYILSPRLTLKGEFTTFETLEAVNLGEVENLLRTGDDLSREERLAQEIVRGNQGKPYITHDDSFISIGFDYSGDKWFGHLQIINFETEPSSAIDQELDRIENEGFDDDDDGDVFPVFFIGRRLGDEDDGFVGGGATAFFNAYGAGLFGGWRFNESMEIGGFIGSVIDVTDGGPPSDPNYESLDDGDALAQIGVSYLF